MSTFRTTITIDDDDVDVEVEYIYHRAYRGGRDSYGAPTEPDEPESVEINSIVNLATGARIVLADEDDLIEKCFDDVRNAYESAMESKADAMRDERL